MKILLSRCYLSFLLFVLFQAGCGLAKPVTATQYKAPFAPTQPYDTVMIAAAIDLTNKKDMEEKMASALSKVSNTRFITHSSIYFVGKKYTMKESNKIIKDNGIKAVLYIIMVDSKVFQSTGYMAIYSPSYGYSGSGTAMITPMTTYSALWETVSGLYDIKMDKSVWVLSAKTGGMSYKKMRSALVKETSKQLVKSGLVQTNEIH